MKTAAKRDAQGQKGGRSGCRWIPAVWKRRWRCTQNPFSGFYSCTETQHWRRVLDWESDLTMENLQWLQMRVSIKGPHGQPEHDYDRDNNHPRFFFFFFYGITFMILFGVNTSDSFLWCVIGFTTTLKRTNSHIHDAGGGIVGIGHVFLKASVKDERLWPTWGGWTISHGCDNHWSAQHDYP